MHPLSKIKPCGLSTLFSLSSLCSEWSGVAKNKGAISDPSNSDRSDPKYLDWSPFSGTFLAPVSTKTSLSYETSLFVKAWRQR